MTQFASISSKNKKSFLKKAFKGLSTDNSSTIQSTTNSNISKTNYFHDGNTENENLKDIPPNS